MAGVVIRRTAVAEYELLVDDDIVETYEREEMRHPDDWIADARNVGASVSGPYDWEYVDDRPDQS